MCTEDNLPPFDAKTFSLALEAEVKKAFAAVKLPQDRIQQLTLFGTRLAEASQTVNLTRILDPEGVTIRHFLDSTYLLPALKKVKGKVVDIGTGGGVPGIPLAVFRRDIQVIMLDGTRKKIEFINSAIQELTLKNASAIHDRMEEHLKTASYSTAVFRASLKPRAAFEILIEMNKPLNRLIFMEGLKGPKRAKDVKNKARKAGYMLDNIIPYKLPGMDNTRHIVSYKRC